MFTLPCLSLRWTDQVWCGNKNTRVCSPRGGAGAQGREELASYLPISAAGSVWGSFLHNRLLKHFTCSVLLVRSRRLQADHPPALSHLVIARLLERAVRRASPAALRSPAAGLLERSMGRRKHMVPHGTIIAAGPGQQQALLGSNLSKNQPGAGWERGEETPACCKTGAEIWRGAARPQQSPAVGCEGRWPLWSSPRRGRDSPAERTSLPQESCWTRS